MWSGIAMAAADPKQTELELGNLERSIELLKRDFEIFFAGASKQPPTDQRDKLDKAIKRMTTLQGMNYALRFRLNSIVARFNSYLDLWNKQLRAKEEGRPFLRTGAGLHVTTQPHRNGPEGEKAREPEQAKPADPFAQVYREYVRARSEAGEPDAKMTFDGFVKVVSKQRDAILQKFQCKDVEFYVAVEQGHTKLKARPIR